ncbi:MAG: aldo/keto reductase [Actinomycetota bacterium]|nr:aldo/keto reductase [Actinomycetota bacterium]
MTAPTTIESVTTRDGRGGETSVPALGLGTWQLRGGDAHDIVARALDVGYRHVDTAQMYGNEAEVGAAIAESAVRRNDLFLTTKIDNSHRSRDAVRRSFDESLAKLRTDHVDLLLLHWPTGDVKAALLAMAELWEEGTARMIGVSNFTPTLLDEAMRTAPISNLQVEHHPYLAQPTLLDLCRAKQVALTAYSPLARGAIADDDVIRSIAADHDATPAQVALRWILDEGAIAIPKTSNPERLEENLGALRVRLTDDDRHRIDALDRVERLIDPPSAPEWERTIDGHRTPREW